MVDSTTVKSEGSFSFKSEIENTGFYQLRTKNKLFNLLIEPGEKIVLTGDMKNPTDYDVDGSDGSLLIQRLNDNMAETKVELDSLVQLYQDAVNNNAEQSVMDSISKSYEAAIEAQRKFNTIFILNFYNNLASLYAIYQRIDDQTFLFNRNRDVQYFKILSDSLTKYYPNSPYVKALQNNTKEFINRINLKKMEQMATVESSLPEIKLPNLSGDSISLSSLKDKKLVLLSFWASWNKESVNENLKLKSFYQKYKNKGFEIYQVSLDNNKEAWQQAVNFDELPWINVSDLAYPNSEAAMRYNIQSLPTHFLLTKDQSDILGKNLSTRDLEIKLSNHLN
jgi:thiol-disulfide isomerase/thioredoxin